MSCLDVDKSVHTTYCNLYTNLSERDGREFRNELDITETKILHINADILVQTLVWSKYNATCKSIITIMLKYTKSDITYLTWELNHAE